MDSKASKRPVPFSDDQYHASAAHSIKRSKLSEANAGKAPVNGELRKNGVQKKLNRLQRAITSQSKSSRSVATTAAFAKKLKKAEKSRGLLAALLDAPLDILYEISLRLAPADLLCLSRVSHGLRNFYLSKSNRRIWVISLASVDLPPCPEDLFEPQYASLMFDTGCTACNAPNIRSPECLLRVRLCKECEGLNVVNRDMTINDFTANVFHGIPPAWFDRVRKAACEYVPYVVHVTRKYSWRGVELLCYKPDLYDALTESIRQLRTKSEEDFEKYVEEKIQLKSNIRKHAEQLRAWIIARQDARSSELANISERHEESVKSKLRQLGYTDADWAFPDSYSFKEDMKQWKRLVYQKRELTERTWKNLLPKLKEFLALWRRKYDEDARETEFMFAYYNYCHSGLTFDERDFLPEESELRKLEVVNEFIFYDDARRQITQEVWDSFIPVLQEIYRNRKERIIRDRGEALIKSRGEFTGALRDLGPLQHILLASSFFYPSTPFSYRPTQYYYFCNLDSIGRYCRESRDLFWSESSDLDLDGEFKVIDLSVPDALLTSLGFPLTTPMLTMQEIGRRFVCCRCVLRKLMGWPALVAHFLEMLERDRKSPPSPSDFFYEDHGLNGQDYAQILTEDEIASATKENRIGVDSE